MPNIMGRDLMSNPKMRDEASRMATEENILSCIVMATMIRSPGQKNCKFL